MKFGPSLFGATRTVVRWCPSSRVTPDTLRRLSRRLNRWWRGPLALSLFASRQRSSPQARRQPRSSRFVDSFAGAPTESLRGDAASGQSVFAHDVGRADSDRDAAHVSARSVDCTATTVRATRTAVLCFKRKRVRQRGLQTVRVRTESGLLRPSECATGIPGGSGKFVASTCAHHAATARPRRISYGSASDPVFGQHAACICRSRFGSSHAGSGSCASPD